MKQIITIFSVFCLSLVNTQTKLDIKLGFKDIRIGDDVSKWEPSLAKKQM